MSARYSQWAWVMVGGLANPQTDLDWHPVDTLTASQNALGWVALGLAVKRSGVQVSRLRGEEKSVFGLPSGERVFICALWRGLPKRPRRKGAG